MRTEDIDYRDGSLALRGLQTGAPAAPGKVVHLDGIAYYAQTDTRSWAAVRAFCDEIFA